MLGRFNLFWLGAGGFLTLFCANEIVSFHLSKTPKWLGGPLMYWAMFPGVVIGLSVALFLGIEEPREGKAALASGAERADEEEDDEDEDDDDDRARQG